MKMTPTHSEMVSRWNAGPEELKRMQTLVVGGEALSWRTAALQE